MSEVLSNVHHKVEGNRITCKLRCFRRSEQGPLLPIDDFDVAREFTIMRMGAAVLHEMPLTFSQLKENKHYIVDQSNDVWVSFEGEGRKRVGILTWRFRYPGASMEAMVILLVDRHGVLSRERALW